MQGTPIRLVKARYFRGVDCDDGDLVRSILATDCELDYRGCCTDPATGKDFMPAMNVVMKGRDSWVSGAFRKAGIVSIHQGHQGEIELRELSELVLESLELPPLTVAAAEAEEVAGA